MPLPTPLRKQLERTVRAARREAESGAAVALTSLGVASPNRPDGLPPAQRELRNRLRAHARQLGDVRSPKGEQGTRRLAREVAYAHWHRSLFARFLAGNGLLIEPESGVAVTPEEVTDLAREAGESPDALAASWARAMLPRIFPPDDPALDAELPPETRSALRKLLDGLPPEVFTADDSLGWVYQFWQADEKDAVNARVKSGEKITGETLPAVTQLFTEHYMVRFLIDNSIGAWWAGKRFAEDPALAELPADLDPADREPELRKRLTVRGQTWGYLRFVEDEGRWFTPPGSVSGERSSPLSGDEGATHPLRGSNTPGGSEPPARPPADGDTRRYRPAAGTFPTWPATAAGVTALDPCCGSGHFLTALLETLAALRGEEEGLDEPEALRNVLADNLFGLELDPRCTQIAAFAVALTAWKRIGEPVELPRLRIACSGIGPSASLEEWLQLADRAFADRGTPRHERHAIRGGLANLFALFEQAPELGSLLDPTRIEATLGSADYATLRPFLSAILAAEADDPDAHERAVAAAGMAEAAEILSGPDGEGGGYTLVMTNVPYLGREAQGEALINISSTAFPDSKNDLATVVMERVDQFLSRGGTSAHVSPTTWTYRKRYRLLREKMLAKDRFNLLVRLGPNSFRSITGWVVSVALTIKSEGRNGSAKFTTLDCDDIRDLDEKIHHLSGSSVDADNKNLQKWHFTTSEEQSRNPQSVISFVRLSDGEKLGESCSVLSGCSAGDRELFIRDFWEVPAFRDMWEFHQSTAESTSLYSGRSEIILWEEEQGLMAELADSVRHLNHSAQNWRKGKPNWGKLGVSSSLMASLPATLYSGDRYASKCTCLVPHDQDDPSILAALWCYAESPRLEEEIRKLTRGVAVEVKTFLDIPFDLPHWQKVAAERYPDGLPEPASDDPTQWLFHGHPSHAAPGTELHVALARLLGYRWPAELDPDMRLSREQRALTTEAAGLGHADEDGVVCLDPVNREEPAADRLRLLLASAYGGDWSAARERQLLAAAYDGSPPKSLAVWLRDDAFAQHCKLFKHRPFLWHVWDGRKDGFHAWLNYHTLAGPDGLGARTLQKLTYSYLGDWIARQKQGVSADTPGAEARLLAAEALQRELELIAEGEAPRDLFVRWKPLAEQPLGWNPDLNDGVRLNIRPWLRGCTDLGRKNAGVLRAPIPNIKHGTDRGKEPESLRPRAQFPWFWSAPSTRKDGSDLPPDFPGGGTFNGVRHNNLHYSLAAKAATRAAAASSVT